MVSEAHAVNARVAAVSSCVCCWACLVALVAVVVTRYPENHIALDVRVCYVLGGLSITAAVLGRAVGGLRAAWLWATLLSGAALVLAVFVLDHWNVLLGHDVWLERGQPGSCVRL